MRRETDFVIAAEGRDKDKVFHLTEMDAVRAEWWAMRALMLVARSGVDIGRVNPSAGMLGIATLGIQALMGGINPAEAKPLLDELMACVMVRPSNPGVPPRAVTPDDIEEVATRIQLKLEVLKLHVDFSQADALLKSAAPASPR